jgi:dihydroorotate dehydrogenase (fumarate)
MSERGPLDLGVTIAGVRFPFCAMNAAGAWSSTAAELRDLARSRTGGIVLKTATVHPFVHPHYRSLHNPGFDKLVPLARELAAAGGERPVVASVAGATAEEYATLARAFTEAGAAMIEANLADPWVGATLAPFENPEALHEVAVRLVAASTAPVAVKLPDRLPLPYRRLADVLRTAAVHVVVARNEFTTFEKLVLETRGAFEVIAVGGIRSGYDVRRALAKGASAVQVGSALMAEGPGVFARLEREMRLARGERAG